MVKKTSDYYFELPDELIARTALPERRYSRLLCLNRTTGDIEHRHFYDLINLLNPNDLVICNNSRVIPARIIGKKETGGRVEVFVERILDSHTVLAHVGTNKKVNIGALFYFTGDYQLEVIENRQRLFVLRSNTASIMSILGQIGEIPLPPYFQRNPTHEDSGRYQTVFAEKEGSVAAPTAGLHLDEVILKQLSDKGIQTKFITLHVGAGTFSPVRVENIEDHEMHSEYAELTPEVVDAIKKTKSMGGRVIAIGTTTARTLETACLSGELTPFVGETNIFIYPGFQFRCVDALITNFHLPGSTLLMLVSALAGYTSLMHAYQVAIQEQYRFYSYGDAMFIYN